MCKVPESEVVLQGLPLVLVNDALRAALHAIGNCAERARKIALAAEVDRYAILDLSMSLEFIHDEWMRDALGVIVLFADEGTMDDVPERLVTIIPYEED